MEGKVNSLTDVLKKTLFFFESLSVEELATYVHQKMLQDYHANQVKEKVRLCLEQHPCFYKDDYKLWRLDLEGNRDNDMFYANLLKHRKPLSVREITKNNKKKKKKKLVVEEARLITDGRFIQHDTGNWGLTEWEVDPSQYSLKHLVIKTMKLHPGGLSVQQVHKVIKKWKAATPEAVEGVLRKFPYFEQVGDGIWCYNHSAKILYEEMMKRYLGTIKRQKEMWLKDREEWSQKVEKLKKQLEEVKAAQQEAASALAEKMDMAQQYDNLAAKLSEKNLLLSLRKKEIIRYREQIRKLENKANSILYQCRQWVKRAREGEAEINRLKDSFNKNRENLKSLFSKLQQYKEKDRENKARLVELKEWHSMRVAELQAELIELKQKMEKNKEAALQEKKQLQEEINMLSNDLREALENDEELQKSLRLMQQELTRVQDENREMKKALNYPLVRLALAISSFLGFGSVRQAYGVKQKSK